MSSLDGSLLAKAQLEAARLTATVKRTAGERDHEADGDDRKASELLNFP